jgi:integrase/recombinase XerD
MMSLKFSIFRHSTNERSSNAKKRHSQKRTCSNHRVKKTVKKSPKENSITLYDAVCNARIGVSQSTSENYFTAYNAFTKFADGKEICLSEISAIMIKEFEQWLLNRGINRSATSCYLRSLRSVYNKNRMYFHSEHHKIFKGVFTGNTVTNKRSLSSEEINNICKVKLKDGTRLSIVRHMFIFCIMAAGMPLVDLTNLKKKDIVDGVITYKRQKTGEKILIKIEPKMQEIINRFDDPDSELVFPLAKLLGVKKELKNYKSVITHYNKALKELKALSAIKSNLTSYVARHTWATIAYNISMDLNTISRGMGHTSIKTTMIYVERKDDKQLFMLNKLLVDTIPIPKRSSRPF